MLNRLIAISLVLVLASQSALANYFNTARSEKIFGIFLTESAQLEEVGTHSNSFGFWPKTLEQITEYLDVNNNRLLPVIRINHFLLDEDTGIYHDDVSGIIAAIEKSTLHGRDILFLWMSRCGTYARSAPNETNRLPATKWAIGMCKRSMPCARQDKHYGNDSPGRGSCISRHGLN